MWFFATLECLPTIFFSSIWSHCLRMTVIVANNENFSPSILFLLNMFCRASPIEKNCATRTCYKMCAKRHVCVRPHAARVRMPQLRCSASLFALPMQRQFAAGHICKRALCLDRALCHPPEQNVTLTFSWRGWCERRSRQQSSLVVETHTHGSSPEDNFQFLLLFLYIFYADAI